MTGFLTRLAMIAIVTTSAVHPALADDELPAPRVGPFTKETYPELLVLRPLTLPQGMFRLYADASYWAIRKRPNATVSDSGVSFGVTDWLQVGVSSRFLLHPDPHWTEWFGMSVRALLLDSESVDIASGFWTALDVDGEGRLFPVISPTVSGRWYVKDYLTVGTRVAVPYRFRDDAGLVQLDLTMVHSYPKYRFSMFMYARMANIGISGGEPSEFAPGNVGLGLLYPVHRAIDLSFESELLSSTNRFTLGATFRL